MNADGFTTLLMIVCISIGGSWYFQNDLKNQMMNHINKHDKDIVRQNDRVNMQADEIKQLKELLKEQNKKIDEQTRQITELQLKVDLHEQNFKNKQYTDEDIDSDHRVRKDKHKPINTQLETMPQVRNGRDGSPGPKGAPGLDGTPGAKGATGPTGPKGDNVRGGAVYIRWGHDSCPDGGAELVYHGRVGGSHYTHQGGGGNPQCLPLDPEFNKIVSGAQQGGYIYGAEYQETNGVVSGSHDTDVPCAVCHVPIRNAVYMLPAKYTCPTGWTREYHGYLMSERHSHRRSTFSCVDHSLKPVIGSGIDHNGFLFYTVEGVCGGSLPCPPYDRNKELSCAVCTK